MLKWLKRLIHRWAFEAEKERRENDLVASTQSEIDRDIVAKFQIEKAVNGHILSFAVKSRSGSPSNSLSNLAQYGPQGRFVEKAILVPDGADLHEAIGNALVIMKLESQ